MYSAFVLAWIMLGKLKDRLLIKTRVSLFRICQNCSRGGSSTLRTLVTTSTLHSKSGNVLVGIECRTLEAEHFVVFGKDDMI